MRHLSLVLAFAISVSAFAQEPGKDALGDPLPKRAVARLGTERMRTLDYSARLHPDGKQVIARVDGDLKLVDPLTGKAGGPFANGKMEWDPAHITADGKRAVGTSFGGFLVWDCDTGKTVYEVKDKTLSLTTVSLSADGKFVATGGEADEKEKEKGVTVRVYDVGAKKLHASLKVAQNSSARLLLSGDGSRGVTWGSHYEEKELAPEADPAFLLEFWDVAAGKVKATARPAGLTGFSAVAMSPTGELVAVGGPTDGSVALFDPATGKKVKELLGRRGGRSELHFSADGKSLAGVSTDGAVQLWDVATGKSLGVAAAPATGRSVYVKSLVFTAPDRAVVLGSEGGTTLVWEAPSGKLLSPSGGHRHPVTAVAFTAGGKEILSAGETGEVLRWDTDGKKLGALPLTLPGGRGDEVQTGRVTAPAGSGLLVREAGDGTVAVHDLATGAEKFALAHAYSGEHPFGVSADGGRLVLGRSGGADPKGKPVVLTVVDVAAGLKGIDITLGRGDVVAVAVTPDGKKAGVLRVVYNDKDEASSVFAAVDLATGKVLGETTMPGYCSADMAAINDTTALVGLPDTGELTLFDLTTGQKGKAFGGGKQTTSVVPVLSPDGKRVACVPAQYDDKPEVVVYEVATGKRTHTFQGHAREISCVAFSPGGKTLASGSLDTTILLWDLSKEK